MKASITFRMGAGRPGGYIYASLPFVYLLALVNGELGLSIFSSLGIIVLIFFLGKNYLMKSWTDCQFSTNFFGIFIWPGGLKPILPFSFLGTTLSSMENMFQWLLLGVLHY